MDPRDVGNYRIVKKNILTIFDLFLTRFQRYLLFHPVELRGIGNVTGKVKPENAFSCREQIPTASVSF